MTDCPGAQVRSASAIRLLAIADTTAVPAVIAFPASRHRRPYAMPKTLIEPFRIKAVEPIRMTTRAEREGCSKKPS